MAECKVPWGQKYRPHVKRRVVNLPTQQAGSLDGDGFIASKPSLLEKLGDVCIFVLLLQRCRYQVW